MKPIGSDVDPRQKRELFFEKVEELKYLVATLSIKYYSSEEINIRINKAEETYHGD